MTIDSYLPLDAAAAQDETLPMTDEAFRLFYDRTARALWAYLARTSGDRRLADDLLQETYYRFLKSRAVFDDDDHRRHYLFRIATNLVLDTRRKPSVDTATAVPIEDAGPARGNVASDAIRRLDVSRAMARLRPRDRALVWLAYVNGSSHKEIADMLDLSTASIKLLLFRARRRLAALLREDR